MSKTISSTSPLIVMNKVYQSKTEGLSPPLIVLKKADVKVKEKYLFKTKPKVKLLR